MFCLSSETNIIINNRFPSVLRVPFSFFTSRAMALNVASSLKTAVGGLLTKRVSPTVVQAVNTYSWEPKEVETHTGQKWEKDDYRLARFVDKEKQVNPSFAIDLINQVPPKECTQRVIYCDGGGGPLGHPKVFINLDKPGDHSCGYCGLRFFKKDSSH